MDDQALMALANRIYEALFGSNKNTPDKKERVQEIYEWLVESGIASMDASSVEVLAHEFLTHP